MAFGRLTLEPEAILQALGDESPRGARGEVEEPPPPPEEPEEGRRGRSSACRRAAPGDTLREELDSRL